jgi:hypothetical protein
MRVAPTVARSIAFRTSFSVGGSLANGELVRAAGSPGRRRGRRGRCDSRRSRLPDPPNAPRPRATRFSISEAGMRTTDPASCCVASAPHATHSRPSRLRPYLLHEPGFEKLGYGPLGLAALWTCRRNQAISWAWSYVSFQRGARLITRA